MNDVARPFVDTNVLLYLLSGDPLEADRAEALLGRGIVISVQLLNEFAHVARRELRLEWPAVSSALQDARRLAKVHSLNIDTHEHVLALAVVRNPFV